MVETHLKTAYGDELEWETYVRVDQNLRIVPNHAPWPLSLHTTGALATVFSY